MHTRLSSASKEVVHRSRPAVLHHRRTDQPDRPPDLPRAAARRRPVGDRARRAAQVEGGAMVLDVNMGVPLTDEPELLKTAIKLVQSLTDLPICIDSSVVEALEAGLSVYEGRALVNSVTAEDDRMAAILPMVKRYGAAVVALPNDHDEIPMEADKRLVLTKKILDTAVDKYGLARRGHRDRPAGDADRRRPQHRQRRLRDDPPDPRRVRRQHDASARPTCRSACRGGTRSTPRSCRWR